jgi:3',5'-cyclic AMP phosphodiesterase CpdA
MTAEKMIEWRQWFDYAFVLMLGDNIYGESGSKEAYAQRFERPYKALIDAGVPFYAALGNHDPIGQENYPLFNMNGRRYYAFEKEEGTLKPLFTNEVLFVAIDSVRLTREQLKWVESTLDDSDAEWKIAFFHHPLYTSGRYQLAASRMRSILEPIFIRQKLDVVLSGHEHFYERITPQNGIQYFTSGAAGALRVNDLRRSGWTAAGFDTDTHFMLMEIAGDTLYFLAISRKGDIVDSGTVRNREDN